jgi:hypothetical protein
VKAVRTIVYVLGLVTLYGLIAIVLALAFGNRLSFVGDSDRLGSMLLFFIVGALPQLIASSLVGVVTASIFPDLGRPLSIVVGLLTGVLYAGSFSFHWHFATLTHEAQIAWALSVIVVIGGYLLVYQLVTTAMGRARTST